MLQRHFILGSEWVYYKIYTGVSVADIFLEEQMLPLTNGLLKENIIDQWFFIRYKDPDFHLRVRFHLKDIGRIGELLIKMEGVLHEYIAQDLIWKVQNDTYSREIERYGASFYNDVETLFYINTKQTLGLLSLIEGAEGEEIRWLFGLKSIDQILNIYFEANLEQKMRFAKLLANKFADEFKMDKLLRNQINTKFKNSHQKIVDFLNCQDKSSDYQAVYQLLDEPEPEIRELIIKINISEHVLGSIIHMMMNRLFKSKNRLHELLMYQFLFLYYRAESYRQKYRF